MSRRSCGASGELGLAHERYDVGHRFGGVDTPEFLAINPNGTIPVVRDDDGEFLWESAAILRYLANRYGRAPYWPADLATRTHIDKWAEWSKINIALNFSGPIFWQVVRTPRRAPGPRRAPSGRSGFLDQYLDIAENAAGEGSHFCAARTSRSPTFNSAICSIAISTSTSSAASAGCLRAYYERLAARPAYRQHVMVSYDELRVLD